MTRREQIARLIDPSSWRVLDSYLEQAKRKYAGQDAGYDPEAFKDRASLAIAAQIMALDAVPDALVAHAAWDAACNEGISVRVPRQHRHRPQPQPPPERRACHGSALERGANPSPLADESPAADAFLKDPNHDPDPRPRRAD